MLLWPLVCSVAALSQLPSPTPLPAHFTIFKLCGLNDLRSYTSAAVTLLSSSLWSCLGSSVRPT